MKKIVYIFLLLCLCGINHIHAESKYTLSSEQLLLLNKFESSFSWNIPALNLNIIDSGDSGHNLFSKNGKKRKKAIKPILTYLVNELGFRIIDSETALIFSPEIFYFFRPYFAGGERDPPVAGLVS